MFTFSYRVVVKKYCELYQATVRYNIYMYLDMQLQYAYV